MRKAILTLAAGLLLGAAALPGQEAGSPRGGGDFAAWWRGCDASLLDLYRHLHRNPELSFAEHETAAKLAEWARGLGFTVATGVGGTGVVAVLENGPGPRVLVRCDMDALPIVEATGLPYASQVRQRGEDGQEVGVMHACGHDLHMTVWAGAARYLSEHRDAWRGTLLLIAQPAEERGAGALAMLEDGLYQRFGTPDYALALHASGDLPAGALGSCPGYALANVDTVDVLVRGRGGHGSAPHTTRDPVSLAARLILGWQLIVSREVKPIEDAVITVGSIHGGSKHNIIPNEVKLQLTVRSYKPEVREQLLRGIERVARFEALAAGFPEELLPVVTIRDDEHTPAAYNDPALAERINGAFRGAFGAERVLLREPSMGGEDFGRYGPAAGCPSYIFWLGTIAEESWRAAQEPGAPPLPSLHTDSYAPLAEPSLRTGVHAMVVAVLELIGQVG